MFRCRDSMNFFMKVLAAVPHLEGPLGGVNGGNLPVWTSLYHGICFIFTIVCQFNQNHNNNE